MSIPTVETDKSLFVVSASAISAQALSDHANYEHTLRQTQSLPLRRHGANGFYASAHLAGNAIGRD